MSYISRGRSRGDMYRGGDATKRSSSRMQSTANFNKAKEALVTLKGGGLRKQQTAANSTSVLETYGKVINKEPSLLNQTLTNAATKIASSNENSTREDHRNNRKRKLHAFYNAGGKLKNSVRAQSARNGIPIL